MIYNLCLLYILLTLCHWHERKDNMPDMDDKPQKWYWTSENVSGKYHRCYLSFGYNKSYPVIRRLVEIAKTDYPSLKEEDIEVYPITKSRRKEGFTAVSFTLECDIKDDYIYDGEMRTIIKHDYNAASQNSSENTKSMMWLVLNHPRACAILFFLWDQMDNDKAVTCSYRVLQDIMGVGKAAIARSLKVLEDNGYIDINVL